MCKNYFMRSILASLLLGLCVTVFISIAYADEVVPASSDISNEVSANSPMTEMLMTAISLIGVNYKYGGNTPDKGFDCSGFVRHLFASTLSIELPRSSMAMAKSPRSKNIDRNALNPGDLVFYNTRKRPYSHVGIYIGEGRFIHAPSRGKSVEIVEMHERYWAKRFNGARRLLAIPSTPTNENAAPN
jgi:cell wall-associated NlpC family hydrolase